MCKWLEKHILDGIDMQEFVFFNNNLSYKKQ